MWFFIRLLIYSQAGEMEWTPVSRQPKQQTKEERRWIYQRPSEAKKKPQNKNQKTKKLDSLFVSFLAIEKKRKKEKQKKTKK